MTPNLSGASLPHRGQPRDSRPAAPPAAAAGAALLDHIEGDGVRTVIVEDASRFARDLITQELGILALIQRGVTVLTATGEDLTQTDDSGWNGRPDEFRCPAAASSAAIARRLRCLPVFGLRRYRRLAMATVSGLSSAWLLRPSHLPVSALLRSRAAFSFETKRAFSNSAKTPAIWRMAFFIGSIRSMLGGSSS